MCLVTKAKIVHVETASNQHLLFDARRGSKMFQMRECHSLSRFIDCDQILHSERKPTCGSADARQSPRALPGVKEPGIVTEEWLAMLSASIKARPPAARQKGPV